MNRWLVVLASLACAGIAWAAAPPTIVVFLSDDHGQLDSTPYGAKDIRTPNLQRLADAGMTFTHAFVASPACAPSRAAMLTGLMPARNGAEENHTFKRDDVRSLTEVIRQAGYEIAAFGKVAHGKDAPRHGFDHIDAEHDTARVAKFLETRSTAKPLCLFVGTHDPHVPWNEEKTYDPAKTTLPPTFVDTPETHEMRARYYTDVTTADTELGEIYDLVRQRFDAKNTLFLYTSDHGAQWPFSKWNLYDAGIRVPFIAVWPGVVKPGARSDAMIQWIDLLPTLIEVIGASVPAGIDGKSFLPVLRGRATSHREEIFTTHSGDKQFNVYPIRSVRTRGWKYIRNLHPEFQHASHINRAAGKDGLMYWTSWETKAITDPAAAAVVKRFKQRPAEELYDLRNDPFELNNLAGDPRQAERLAAMRRDLDAWMMAQGDQQKVFHQPLLLGEPATPLEGGTAPKKKKSQP
jgi:arylsulfatase A-like enzyme